MIPIFLIWNLFLVTVIFEGSGYKLQTVVAVSKGNIVFIDAPKETLTNVPFPAKGYSFTVKFRFVA